MNFTYRDIFNFVYEKLQIAYGWTVEILAESVYANIINAFSYGVEQLAFYDEILTKESVYKSAELPSSINYISWMLNYTPHRRKGAISSVYVSADPNFLQRAFNGNPNTPYVYSDSSTFITRWTPIVGDNITAYATEDTRISSNTSTYHYYLPVASNGSKVIELIDNEGTALIPLTVTQDDLNSGLLLNQNLVSTNILRDNKAISEGSLVNIKGSSLFSGEFFVTRIPNALLVENPLAIENYIAIKTNYFSQEGLTESIQQGTVVSVGQVKVAVKEGVPLEYEYFAIGSINEKIPIYSPTIDNDELQVFLVSIDNEITEEVTLLTVDSYLVNDLSKYYCVVYNDPEFRFIYFEFGDDIKTKKLRAGQKVLIRYAETLGASGNTASNGVINSFGEGLISNNGDPVVGLYPTNITGFVSGTDYEDIDTIKFNSRASFNNRNLLIADWTPIINNYSSVLKSVSWTEVDQNPYIVDFTKQNIVNISAINKSGKIIFAGSVDANNIIYLYLRKFSSPTDVILFQDTNIINVKPVIYYKIKPTNVGLFRQTIITNIKNSYDVYNSSYNTSLYASNIVQIVEEYPEVIYCRVYLSYVETSVNNRYLTADSNAIYLTGTYKDNKNKDSFLGVGDIIGNISVNNVNINASLSLYIRRKVDGIWQSWIKIGKQVDQLLVFNEDEFNSQSTLEFNEKILVHNANFIDNIEDQVEESPEVGDIVCAVSVDNGLRYTKATPELEQDDEINAFFYVESYNHLTGNFTLVESGSVSILNLESITQGELLNEDGELRDENNLTLDGGFSYFISTTAGKLTKIKGNATRKFLFTVEVDNNVKSGVIVKGFYFSDCPITNTGLASVNTGETPLPYYNYIASLSILSIKNSIIPNSNTISLEKNYSTIFDPEIDILNPDNIQNRGYELKIQYNTVEKIEAPNFYNEIRLPFINNILDVNADDIEFIEET